MSVSFPTTLDSLNNPASTDALNNVTTPHHTQHSDANDAIEALEAKVGINSSTVVTSLDFRTRLKFSNTSVPGGNTVANTTTETAFTSSYTIPANALAAGDHIRITLRGVFSQDVVPATLRARVKAGATTLLDTGALSGFVNVTNSGWKAEIDIKTFTIGASGTIDAFGDLEFATAANAALKVEVPNTSTFTVDTTATIALTVTAQWGTASAANTVTLRQMTVEMLKV